MLILNELSEIEEKIIPFNFSNYYLEGFLDNFLQKKKQDWM
jgi:hypothetical protein